MPRASKPSTSKRATTRKNGAAVKPQLPPVFISHEEIARLAYELFVQRGAEHGRDLDNWLDAERQLTQGQ